MKTKAQMISAEPRIRMPGLAQALAEEAKRPARVDEAGDAGAEAGDLAEGVEPAARDVEPADHRIACSSGLVASRTAVKT